MIGENNMAEEIEILTKTDDKGRVTIPRDVREFLGISKGDFIRLKVKKAEKEE